MRDNEDINFQYKSVSDKSNPEKGGAPNIDGIDTNNVTMYVENNIGSQIHESRHGGDVARGELSLANYNIQHEVSAYRTQYSISGGLKFIPGHDRYNDPVLLNKMLLRGILSFQVTITDINSIKPVLVNMMVDNPGLRENHIYNF